MSTSPSDTPEFLDDDRILARELNHAIRKYRRFLHALGTALEAPLNLCDWWLVPSGDGMELVIYCGSSNIRTYLMDCLLAIATRLNRRFGPSTIRILGESYSFETSTDQVINYYENWESYHSDNNFPSS